MSKWNIPEIIEVEGERLASCVLGQKDGENFEKMRVWVPMEDVIRLDDMLRKHATIEAEKMAQEKLEEAIRSFIRKTFII